MTHIAKQPNPTIICEENNPFQPNSRLEETQAKQEIVPESLIPNPLQTTAPRPLPITKIHNSCKGSEDWLV